MTNHRGVNKVTDTMIRFSLVVIGRCLIIACYLFTLFMCTVVPALLSIIHGPVWLLYVIPIVVWIRQLRRDQATTHGSARWATLADIYYSGLADFRGGAFLGKLTGLIPASHWQSIVAIFSLPWRQSQMAMNLQRGLASRPCEITIPESICPHTSMVSPTGGGKTVTAAASMLRDRSSVFVNDAKGLELFHLTGLWRHYELGQKVAVIAPFATSEEVGEFAATYNPLQSIDPTSKFVIDDTRSIAESLIPPKPGEHNPFFTNAARMLVHTVATGMVLEFPAEQATLPNLRQIIAVEDELRDFLYLLKEKSAPQHRLLFQRLVGQTMSITGRTWGDVLSTVNSELQWIDGSSITESLSSTSFNPGDWFNHPEGLSIYFSVPPDRLHEYRSYYRVVVTSLINFIFRNGAGRNRNVRFYLDESYSLGKLESLYSALIYGRSYGIRLSFFWQGLGQIQEVFPDTKADDFVANTSAIFMGIRDFKTAEFVSNWIGRHTIETLGGQSSFQYGQSRSYSASSGETFGSNWGGSQTSSKTQAQRQLILPEEILQLPRNTMILLVPHVRPILARYIRYFEDRQTVRDLRKFYERFVPRESWWSRVRQWITDSRESYPIQGDDATAQDLDGASYPGNVSSSGESND